MGAAKEFALVRRLHSSLDRCQESEMERRHQSGLAIVTGASSAMRTEPGSARN